MHKNGFLVSLIDISTDSAIKVSPHKDDSNKDTSPRVGQCFMQDGTLFNIGTQALSTKSILVDVFVDDQKVLSYSQQGYTKYFTLGNANTKLKFKSNSSSSNSGTNSNTSIIRVEIQEQSSYVGYTPLNNPLGNIKGGSWVPPNKTRHPWPYEVPYKATLGIVTPDSYTYCNVQNKAAPEYGKVEVVPENSKATFIIHIFDKSVKPSVNYCFNCGNKIEPEHKFCSKCGTKVK